MELEPSCKHCNCVKSCVKEDPTFAELVSECKSTQHKFESEDIKLGKPGVLKWLLTYASQNITSIDPLDIDKIVEQCVFSSEDDMIEILKENKVLVELKDENKSYLINETSVTECAAKYGNPEIISWLLSLQINSHIKGHNNLSSMLFNAVAGGKLNNIKILMKRADIKNPLGSSGESALEIAAKHGHLHIIQWLLDSNNENSMKISYSNTLDRALYQALSNCHYHIVEYIIENTIVDLNYALDVVNGGTIIHVAASLNNVNLVKWLVHKGAVWCAKDYAGKTIADIAVEIGSINILTWFSTQDSEYKLLYCKPTLLHIAALNGHYECVEFLVHRKFDVESKDEKDKSVLNCAVLSGNVKIVKFLINHGAKINISTKYQNELMLSAYQSLEMIQLLSSLGLDLNAKTFDNDNVLGLAARCNNYDVVEWLLEQGMNVREVVKYTSYWLHKTSEDNCRLLRLCIKYMKESKIEFETSNFHKAVTYPEVLKIMLEHNFGSINCFPSELLGKLLIDSLHFSTLSLETAYYLLNHGADVTVIDNNGKTALYNAAFIKDISLVKKLVELGSDVKAQTYCGDNIINVVISTGDLDIVKYIVEMGANIHSQNYKGSNTINIAAFHRNWNIVKYLVELGVNINLYSHFCDPVLYLAIDAPDPDVDLISWLLDHGAQPNITPRLRDPILHEVMCCTDENKKIELLKLLIKHGANVNALNTENETILFHCLNNVDIVDYLIKVGIDVSIQRDDSYTALHKVMTSNDVSESTSNQIKVISKLINNCANINVVNELNETLLHIAVRNANIFRIFIVQQLIKKGCNVNAVDYLDQTALLLSRDAEISLLLIKHGANVNFRAKNGMTALLNAIDNAPERVKSQFNIVSYIQNYVTSDDHRVTKRSMNNHIVESNFYSRYMNYVEYLVSIVDDSLIDSMAIIKFAIEHDNVCILKTFLNRSERILFKFDDGNTILHSAASKGSLNIVIYILDHMKHELLFKGNNANETPLHLAISSNNMMIIKLLLKHDVDVDHKTNKGITALHIACENGNLETVKLLLDYGADIYEPSCDLSTPISLAVQYCKHELFTHLVNIENVNIIKCKNSTDQTLLHIAAKSGKLNRSSIKIMQYLLNSKVIHIDAIDKLGNSALHYACCTHVIASIELLIENGANVNLKNKTGNTPLHYAAKTGDISIVEYLIKCRAKIRVKNHKGNNPIHMAIAHNKTHLINVLIEKPDDLYIRNRKGNCILHQAAACRGSNNILYQLKCKYEDLNINRFNNKNESPLYLAVKFNVNNNIQLCLTEEVVNVQNVHGKTPLHVYLSQQSENELDDDALFLKFILSGADLTLPNKLGKTSMELAFVKHRT